MTQSAKDDSVMSILTAVAYLIFEYFITRGSDTNCRKNKTFHTIFNIEYVDINFRTFVSELVDIENVFINSVVAVMF